MVGKYGTPEFFQKSVTPNDKCALQARILPQKKVKGPVALECISRPVPSPQNNACSPRSVVKSRSKAKKTSER